jgi:hypothetical protein
MRMQAAGRAWYAADIAQVRAHLNACPGEFRGWEYDYLQALLERPVTLRGHPAEILRVAFSPDGRRLASGSGDSREGTVKIWDNCSSVRMTTVVLPQPGGPVRRR